MNPRLGTLGTYLLLGALVVAIGASFRALTGSGGESPEGGTAVAGLAPARSLWFDDTRITALGDRVEREIEDGAFPGAAIAFGIGAEEAHAIGFGHIGWTRNAPEVDPRATMYDLASMTKLLATASAVMLLVEEGRLSLDDPVSRFLPGFSEEPKAAITLRHVLTHTSGLPAGAEFRGDTREERISRALRFPIFPPAGARAEYSDVGYVLLWEALEHAAGEPLTSYLERKLYRPLGMQSTRFSPGLECEACAPTGRLRDQSLYRGRPFDPIAQRFDGVTGNAGLFSTAHDIGRFAAMIVNGGELDGVRVFREETVEEFTRDQPLPGSFRLGWEVFCREAESEGGDDCARIVAIGHTGWTGTSLQIDPDSGAWFVLLTNRTYEPRAQRPLRDLRRDLWALSTRSQPTSSDSSP